jgi:hypothetical protein
MRFKGPALVVVVLLAAASLGADSLLRLADRRVDDTAAGVRLTNVLVVGISDDRDVRNRFEDRFVSNLRGRGVMASASHSIVPDLTDLEDRDRILEAIHAEGVDAVLTVRAIAIERHGESDWVAAWNAWAAAAATPRELIEASLPVSASKSKKLGIEFGLWDLRGPRRLWAARSDVVTRKQLDRGSEDLLLAAIGDLKDRGWF